MTMRKTTTTRKTLTTASVHKFFYATRCCLLCIIGAASFFPASAQTDTLSLPSATITERLRAEDDLTPTQSLSGHTLRSLSSQSVADALRYFTGVQLKDYGGLGGLKTINVRGMGSQHVGVMVDGVPLVNAQNGTIDLGRFDLDNLQSISLYNSQRTTLLQPAAAFASSSALYLQTLTPHFFQDNNATTNKRDWSLRARLRIGSFGTVQPTLNIEKPFSSHTVFSLSAGYIHSDGNYNFRYKVAGAYDTTGTRRNGDINAWRIESGLWGKTARSQWHIYGYLYTSSRGLPGAIVRGRGATADRQWDTNLFLQSSWQYRINHHYTHLFTGKLAYDYLHYLTDPKADPQSMFADNRYRTSSLYLSSAHRLVYNKFAIAIAADYRAERMTANLYDFPTPTRHTGFLSLTARTTKGPLRLQANLLATAMLDHTQQHQAMPRRTALSPAVNIAYQPWHNTPLTLQAFIKHSFRPPTLCDLYYTLVGNSNLKPERTWQYNVGATYKLPQWTFIKATTLRINAYHNAVSDKIVAIPSTSLFRWTMLNLGRVSIQGLEAEVKTNCEFSTLVLTLQASYTYERARDITDKTDAFYGDQVPYIPRHSGSIIALLSWKNFALNYSFIYTGSRYTQRANTTVNYMPAWYTNDLTLSYRLKHLDVALTCNNLFQQRYELVRGYPLPGRHWIFSMGWKL